MKHLNEKHSWFNLEKNEECILRYTTKDGSMLDGKHIERLENNTNKVAMHKYGVIVFLEPLRSIGNSAFYDCKGLTSITIPNSVTSIGNKAFRDCTDLTSVTIPNSARSIGDYAFDGCICLIFITIGNGVTSMGECAFYWCSNLTSITIPNSVTSIGSFAFSGCNNLTNIIYKGTLKEFNTIDYIKYAFAKEVNIHCTDGDITI